MLERSCWTDGSVYILPRTTFRHTSTGTVRFDEWASPVAVVPLARLAVAPGDFPFLQRVPGHDDNEPMALSWLRDKRRTRRG